MDDIDSAQQRQIDDLTKAAEANKAHDTYQWAGIAAGLILLGYLSLVVFSFNFNRERRLILQVEPSDLREVCAQLK